MKKIIMLICLAIFAGISFNEVKANSAPGEYLGTIATLTVEIGDEFDDSEVVYYVPQFSYPIIGVNGPGHPQYSQSERRITVDRSQLQMISNKVDHVDIDILVNMTPGSGVTYGYYVLRINLVKN